MKVTINHLECGGPGTIIDCSSPKIFCPFCKEYVSWYSETREVSPQQLVQLIRDYKYIIKIEQL